MTNFEKYFPGRKIDEFKGMTGLATNNKIRDCDHCPDEKGGPSIKWKSEHPEAMREYARRYRARHKDDPAYKAKKKIYNDTYRGKLKKAA